MTVKNELKLGDGLWKQLDSAHKKPYKPLAPGEFTANMEAMSAQWRFETMKKDGFFTDQEEKAIQEMINSNDHRDTLLAKALMDSLDAPSINLKRDPYDI
jgi:hypothetical protein